MIAEITSAPSEPHPKTWIWASAAYFCGLLGAEASVGATAGWVGAVIRSGLTEEVVSWGILTVSVVTLAYGLRELGILRMPMPQNPWQVPVQWSRRGKIAQSLLYGAVLGTEVSTFIPYATFYVLLLLEASVGPAGGAAIGFTYGLARGISVLFPVCYSRLRTWRRHNTHEERVQELACHIDSIYGARPLAHVANGIALLAVGQLILGSVWRLG